MTFCRTPEDAFQAGWDAAQDAPALTPTQIDRLVLLHRPYLVPEASHGTASRGEASPGEAGVARFGTSGPGRAWPGLAGKEIARPI